VQRLLRNGARHRNRSCSPVERPTIAAGEEANGGLAMKRFVCAAFPAAVMMATLAPAAHAADLKPHYKTAAPVASWSWSGIYAGINLGVGVGHNQTIDTGTYDVPAATITSQPYNESLMHSPLGAIGGGQIGYNLQLNPHVVLGAEADWQATGQKDTICTYTCGSNTVGFFNLGGAGDSTRLLDSQQLRWFATARARIGYAANRSLWYATGGAAYGRLQENFLYNTAFIPGLPNPLPPGPAQANFSRGRTGWTIGGGVEAQLWGNWSAKAEYLYIDFGGITDTWVIAAPLFGLPTFPSSLTNVSSFRFTDHVVRLGLNYRFGSALAAY
jgi:outer membrane immunogenic protein